MTESPVAPPGSFHPRNGALIVSGILLGLNGLMAIGTGVLSLLQVVLMKQMGGLDAKTAAELEGMQEMMWSVSLVNLIVYGGLGVLFIVAAFGCFTFRRWARPLNLTLGWAWLYMGVVMMLSLVMMMGAMREAMARSMERAMAGTPGAPPGMDGIFGIIIAVYLGLIFLFLIVPPGIILWLNWSEDVRHTLESRDPVSRWTDRRPVTLIGLTIGAILFAVMSLPGILMMHQPWMASFLPPAPLKYLWYLIPLVWAYVAWGSYHRQIAAWIVAMLALLGGAAMGIFSMRDIDWAEVYRQMGIPEGQMGEMVSMMEAMFDPAKIGVLMAAAMVPMVGFLVWVLKDFRKAGATREGIEGLRD